jgi:hypothetical protein
MTLGHQELLDYDRLMREHLTRVFNERDSNTRLKAIEEIYADDATLYESADSSVQGHLAINQAVDALLSSLPPAFTFTSIGPAVGHHGVGRLRWKSGSPDGSVGVTGMDVIHFVNGRIQSTYVFLDPPAA